MEHDHVTQCDEATEDLCRFKIKVLMDVVVVATLIYFIIEAVKDMRFRRPDRWTAVMHFSARNWEDVVALVLCIAFLLFFAFDLVVSCYWLVTQLVLSQKIEPVNDVSAEMQRVHDQA